MSEEELQKSGRADFSVKRNLRQIVVLLVVLFGIGIAWWIWSRANPNIASPTEVLTNRKPIVVNQTETVPSGKVLSIPINVTTDQAPGLLTGTWSSSGKSAGIKGANDDTLVGFTLKGPDNKAVQALDHPVTGNVNIRVPTAGTYTLVFSNAGIIRSSSRRVQMDIRYEPD